MDHEIQLFHNDEFGEVRTVTIDGEPWFVGIDVARILDYQNCSRDINAHVDDEDKLKYQMNTLMTLFRRKFEALQCSGRIRRSLHYYINRWQHEKEKTQMDISRETNQT